MTKLKIINVDEGDENADWIKRVSGGRSRRQELAIHDQLANDDDDTDDDDTDDDGTDDVKGGPGSGFHGHAGRPGEVGGAAPAGTAARSESSSQQGLQKLASFVSSKHGVETQIAGEQVVGRLQGRFAVFNAAGRATDWTSTLQEAVDAWERIRSEIKQKQEIAERQKELESRRAEQMGRLAKG